MKYTQPILAALFGFLGGKAWAIAQGPTVAAPAQFTSTLQLAIHEPNEVLIRRAQKLVIQQFAATLEASPELHGRPYEVDTRGNEVSFVFSTPSDVRAPFESAALKMVGTINDRVRGSGRISFFKTNLERPYGGYFKVVVDDMHSRIRSVAAQSVPLRDLLKELRAKLGGFSYLIPGECAERAVDWSFGEEDPESEPKQVAAAMAEIATLFGLKSEKRNGTFIFTGSCADSPAARRVPSFDGSQAALTPVAFPGAAETTQVFLLPPLVN